MLDKVSDPSLPDSLLKKDVKDLQLLELLPDARVQENLVWQWSVLVIRVVTKYLKAIPAFRDGCDTSHSTSVFRGNDSQVRHSKCLTAQAVLNRFKVLCINALLLN